jgi:hypothetical protein
VMPLWRAVNQAVEAVSQRRKDRLDPDGTNVRIRVKKHARAVRVVPKGGQALIGLQLTQEEATEFLAHHQGRG